MPRPISYAVFCLKKKKKDTSFTILSYFPSTFFFHPPAPTHIYTLSLHALFRSTLSNLKLLRRITRTENILHRNFTRRQVAIQNRVASNIGISQSTFSVKVLNL